MTDPDPRRPPVSVVVPFLGAEPAARALLDRLRAVELRPADELIVADNTEAGAAVAVAGAAIEAVAARERRSASYARNAGAAAAAGEWLLFLDADCVPPPDLVERYFDPPPAEGAGIVAGEVVGDPSQPALAARWARSRRGRWVRHHQSWGPLPAGVTANLLVRRKAFAALGGFRLGGGGDLDLCWRAQREGWGFEYRPRALVRHRDRESLRELGAQARGYGSHLSHLRRLHAGVPRSRLAAPLARAAGGAAVWTLRGDRERALFKLIDGYWFALSWWGQLRGPPAGVRAD